MARNPISHDSMTDYQPWEPQSLDADSIAAHNVKLPTAESLEGIHQQAYQEGYDAGYEEGQAAGYREGSAQARKEAQQLHALLQSVEAAIQQLGQETSEELLALALDLSKQMLRQALKVKPELMLGLVRGAIDSVPQHAPHPHLHLHPDDAALIRTQMQAELTQGGWKIIEDQRISRGGCRIETAIAEVDATLASRWQRMVAALGQDAGWLD